MQRLQKQVLVTTLASLLIILLDTRFSLLDPPIPASSSNQVICTHIDQFPFAGFFPPGKLWQLPKLLFNCIIDVIGKNKFPKLPEITIFQESVFLGICLRFYSQLDCTETSGTGFDRSSTIQIIEPIYYDVNFCLHSSHENSITDQFKTSCEEITGSKVKHYHMTGNGIFCNK